MMWNPPISKVHGRFFFFWDIKATRGPGWWFQVEPTHLKNMQARQIGSFFPQGSRVKIKNL